MAGGRGRRMGGIAKQFRPLDGRPTVCWGARALLDALSGPLVVVLPQEALAEGEALLRRHFGRTAERIRVAPGGSDRQESVRIGLELLDGTRTVLVHDAARPFASTALVERVARHADAGRAVVPAVPIPDTLKEIEGDRVVRTHDRSRFVAAQTPQGFPLVALQAAHEGAPGAGATDDAALCELRGTPVRWVTGERLNRKLTVPEDWAWAEEAIATGRIRWRGP